MDEMPVGSVWKSDRGTYRRIAKVEDSRVHYQFFAGGVWMSALSPDTWPLDDFLKRHTRAPDMED